MLYLFRFYWFLVAMPKAKPKIHLEIQTSRKNPVGILRTTFWDPEVKKYRHEQMGRITGKTKDQLKTIQAAIRGDLILPSSPEAPKVIHSRELGASRAIFQIIHRLGLAKMIYSRKEAWVGCILAMIMGRLIFSGSKLALCNLWESTCLWELCGVEGRPNVQTHCYEALDRLHNRQEAIQKGLVEKHKEEIGSEQSLLLYDITSTYLEGEYEESQIVDYGYNRDRKKGTKQVVVGLVCTSQGCPLAVEVFKGNTKDDSTVLDKVKELRESYGIEKYTFVGDRGMLTAKNLEQLSEDPQLTTITALTHGNMRELLEKKVVQIDLFDEKNICEITDPEAPAIRYCLCKNPQSAERETATRARLLELTEDCLKQIANYKRACTVEQLGARVGRVLEKYKMGKFIQWSIEAAEGEKSSSHKLHWELKEEKIKTEQQLDGCYIIRTDVPKKEMSSEEAVAGYKNLGNIERAFRNLKTVSLEMRPIYHKTDKRIEAHIFLCMLAYYVQWHMHQAWQPIYEEDGDGADREFTFNNLMENLKCIRSNTMVTGEVQYELPTETTETQTRILSHLEKI